MKKNIILLLSLAALFGCEKYLDKAPDFGLMEEDVFSDFYSTRGYLDNCYNLVVDYTQWNSQRCQRAHLSQLSDEGANPYPFTPVNNFFNKGNWLGQPTVPEVGWGSSDAYTVTGRVIPMAFAGLRICNKILEKVPGMTVLTDAEKKELTGQAYFFRGWFYFEIIRRVGGMPLLDKVFHSDSELDLPRLDYGQSNEWVIRQMDTAIELLPDRWPDNQKGRATKVAAYAVRSMAQLYAASPLMRNKVDQLVQYEDYDGEQVKLAAQYAKECLDYIETTMPVHRMMSGENYKNIFYHSSFVSDESLWYINSAGATRSTEVLIFWQNVGLSGNTSSNYSQAVVSATQNIVDKFETSNGYPVQLTESGWVCEDAGFDPEFPYSKRDPRLGHFILLPGEEFGTNSDGSPMYICTWEGGRDLTMHASYPVRTRYMIKKWMWPSTVTGATNSPGYKDYFFNCVHIRTTQVWLDYAEAMNEAYGPNGKPAGYDYSAVEAINKIRERVGMVAVRDIYTADKNTFRDRIRNERAVELMFENHRWHDLRRWMIAEKTFEHPQPITYPEINIVNPAGSSSTRPPADGKFTYTLRRSGDEVRVFERKHHWYPVGKDEAERFVNFKQNPGW